MKPNFWILPVLAILPVPARNAPAGPSRIDIIALNNSHSMRNWRPAAQLDVVDTLQAMPAGRLFQLKTFGSQPRTLAMGFAAMENTGNAVNKVLALRFNQSQSNVGALLHSATTEMKQLGIASSTLTIFTDCVDNGGSPGTKSLSQMLADPAIVPAGMTVRLRCYDPLAAPRVSRSHLSVLTLPVSVHAAFQPPALPGGQVSLVPEGLRYRFGAAALVLFLAGGVITLRMLHRRHLASLPLGVSVAAAAKATPPSKTVSIRCGSRIFSLEHGQSVLMGPASLQLPVRNAPATVKIAHAGNKITVTNLGPLSISVGRLVLTSGSNVDVREQSAELRVGEHTAFITSRLTAAARPGPQSAAVKKPLGHSITTTKEKDNHGAPLERTV